MRLAGWLTTLGLCAALVGGCSRPGDKWENPSVSQSAWEVHEAECRRLASQRAEDEFAPVEPVISETFGRQTTYRTEVARFDARQRRDYLFERCMKDRGYRRGTRPAVTEPPATEAPAPAAGAR